MTLRERGPSLMPKLSVYHCPARSTQKDWARICFSIWRPKQWNSSMKWHQGLAMKMSTRYGTLSR